MDTTALIVEFLVVGVFSSIWIALLLVSFVGTISASDLSDLSKFSSILLFPYLAVSYCLGVLTNRACDFLFKRQEERIAKPIWNTCGHDYERYFYERLVVLHYSERLSSYLDRLWALVRIFRSTIFNIVLMGAAVLAYIWLRTAYTSWKQALLSMGTIILGSLLFLLLWKSWKKVTHHYHRNVIRAYEIVMNERQNKQTGSKEAV